jgi:polysaccharide transporter, PST family
MLNKILYNKPFQNFIYISLYQAVNFLALVIFIPYLTKFVGIEKYGSITIMQAICSFFFVLVDYGFSVTSVRKLSIFRENKTKIETIIKNTLGAKILLVLLAFPIFMLVPIFFLKTDYDLAFVAMSFVAVLGQAIFPAWLCQGLEENKLAFIANLINKLILYIFVICFIREESQYSYFLFFMGFASFITGLFLLLFVLKYRLGLLINFNFSSKEVFSELNEGKEVFLSNFSIGSYLSANVLILSLFVSPLLVGLYGIAERIMMLLRTLLGVFVQATYPLVCKLVYELSIKKVINKVFFFTTPFIVSVILLCLSMSFFSFEIASFFSAKNQTELSGIIKKLSFLPLLVSLNIVPNLVILACNKEKVKSYILLFSTGFSFVLSFLLVPHLKIDGAILIMYAIELIVAVASIYYMMSLKNLNLPNLHKKPVL